MRDTVWDRLETAEPICVEGAFGRRAELKHSISEMLSATAEKAQAQFGRWPEVALLGEADYRSYCHPVKVVLYRGMEVIAVTSLLPGNCFVGWREEEV